MRSSGFSVLLVFAAVVTSPVSAADASSPEAQLQKACRDVMGFYPGEVRFDVCMRSLKRSLQHYEQARAHSCMTEEVNSSAGHSAPCIVTSVKKTATTGRD